MDADVKHLNVHIRQNRSTLRQQEQMADTPRRRIRRENAEFRQHEQFHDTVRKRLQHEKIPTCSAMQ